MPARRRPMHRQRPPALARQRGVALILIITVLVIGVVWYTVGALGKAAPTTAERETKTGIALQNAKQALLAYVALYAAQSSSIEPGQMPCPEFLSSIGTSSQGQAGTSCSNASPTVGRLPWETLGVDEIRDGYGEPIWYVLSPGFRSAPINFGTPGQLSYNGSPNVAVALLIAPGPALNTQADPATPPAGCSKVNQQVSTRNTASLAPANFLECGNDTGTGNYAIPGPSEWTNDRVIEITAAEWAQAIAGPVADRLQRQVAPVLTTWDQTEQTARGKSWGSTYGKPYMPYASTFTAPTVNDYCGDAGVVPSREGLPPSAATSSGTCATNWSGSVSAVLGLVSLGCTNSGTELVCSFLRLFGSTPFSVTITAQAPNVANSFRGTITQSDAWVTGGGSVNSLALTSFSATTGTAQIAVTASWPFVGVFATVEVHIPNLPDAVFMSDPAQPSYTATKWFRDNTWQRYTYYAVGSGVTLNPSTVCAAPGDAGCLTLNGMPASNGNSNDKKLILALMGPGPVGAQTQPSNNSANYLESHTGGSTIYTAATVTSGFNDRLAACPFRQTPASGGPIAICN